MRKTIIAAVAVSALAAALTGCDTGPECIESHTEVRWVPYSTIIGGKATVQSRVETVTVCDKYAPEGAK